MSFKTFNPGTVLLITAICLTGFSNSAVARSLYLNGLDISSARNQNLKNINLRIDENGNIYIDAPHYQVNEEESFSPLSTWLKGVNTPKHSAPGKLSTKTGAMEQVQPLKPVVAPASPMADPAATNPPIANNKTPMQDKAGTKTGG